MAADIGQGLLGIASSYAKKDMGGLIKGGLGILRAAGGGAQKAGEYQKKTRTSPADVVSTLLSVDAPWDSIGVVDFMEWLQGFSNQCGYCGSWTSYGCYELRGFPFTSAMYMTNIPHALGPQAFTFVLTQNKNQTYQQLLNSVRDILKSKYSQKPQLAASHPIVCSSICDSFR